MYNKIGTTKNIWKNLVRTLIPKNNPAREYFLRISKKNANKKKDVAGISVWRTWLYWKNVGKNARKTEERKATYFPNISFAIIYVRKIIPAPKKIITISPKIISLTPIFQKKPRINGQMRGLFGSQRPTKPPE